MQMKSTLTCLNLSCISIWQLEVILGHPTPSQMESIYTDENDDDDDDDDDDPFGKMLQKLSGLHLLI